MWYQNVRSALFSFVTIHASDGRTDRRTDGRTELRQQYRALHYMQSHAKNVAINDVLPLKAARRDTIANIKTFWGLEIPTT